MLATRTIVRTITMKLMTSLLAEDQDLLAGIVLLSRYHSWRVKSPEKVTWSYPQGGQWNREGVISKNANRDICALQTATDEFHRQCHVNLVSKRKPKPNIMKISK